VEHVVHAGAAPAEKEPAEQAVHVAAPIGAYVPAPHGVQVVLDVVVHVPLAAQPRGHVEHAVHGLLPDADHVWVAMQGISAVHCAVAADHTALVVLQAHWACPVAVDVTYVDVVGQAVQDVAPLVAA
jgi:hypothetical protein